MTTSPLFDLDDVQLPRSLREALEHGEVFTRSWVVETVLDLVGYTANRDLAEMVIAEPACGEGAFLGPIVRRLSTSCRNHGKSLVDAVSAIEAYDLLSRNVQLSRDHVAAQLVEDGWEQIEVDKVVHNWISQGDYLLGDHSPQHVDFVVGNPPYVRLEDVPQGRMRAYRNNCATMGGRADLYVGFYERGLRSLKSEGRLGFICADRWMRNQYGRNLRHFVTRDYSVDLVLSMHDVDAFEEQVSAYPAITIISRTSQGAVIAADTNQTFGSEQAKTFCNWAKDGDGVRIETDSYNAERLPHWFVGEEPWPAASPARLAMLEDLYDRFGPLEDANTGTRVGIGIATGADSIFLINDKNDVDIEDDRLLPMAMVRDTTSGSIRWHGTHLINPWSPEGKLVDLAQYPRLASYFNRHRSTLEKRYVAGKNPNAWYKTIDKVNHELTKKPKLFFPDLKSTIHPVLDEGKLYPHHNLYFIVSETWDPRVLGGLLLSKVAEAFISAYAVKMRGGTLRFQAQYLRRIRVPDPSRMSARDCAALAKAFDDRDVQAATTAALRAYKLDSLPD